MKYDTTILKKLHSIVIEAIDHGYDLIDFFEDVNYSIINAILRGHIFDDYLANRDLVEDLDYVGFIPPEENWDDLVKAAIEKKGVNYVEEMEKVKKTNKRINKELKKAFDSGELVINVTMDEIVKRAFHKEKDFSKSHLN